MYEGVEAGATIGRRHQRHSEVLGEHGLDVLEGEAALVEEQQGAHISSEHLKWFQLYTLTLTTSVIINLEEKIFSIRTQARLHPHQEAPTSEISISN